MGPLSEASESFELVHLRLIENLRAPLITADARSLPARLGGDSHLKRG
jgi:hypothetical protein